MNNGNEFENNELRSELNTAETAEQPQPEPQAESQPAPQPQALPQYQQPVYSQQPVYTQQPVYVQQPEQPGHSLAVASLVLGIVSLVLMWFDGAGLITAIVGICLAVKAKKMGNTEGINKAGLIMSIITASISAVIFVSCVACTGCVLCAGAAGSAGVLEEYGNSLSDYGNTYNDYYSAIVSFLFK